jgi:hypothetical protein
MGQGQSAPDLSNYHTKSDITNLLRSYVTSTRLNSTKDELVKLINDLDKLYVEDKELASYISKDDLRTRLETELNKIDQNFVKNTQLQTNLGNIDKNFVKNTQLENTLNDINKNYASKTELSPLAKSEDVSKNYVNKIDKAKYSSENVTDNTTYVTPLYWSERYLANKSSLQESENNDEKFITPKYVNEKKTSWTVDSSNDPRNSSVSTNQFVTPNWVTNKLTQQMIMTQL